MLIQYDSQAGDGIDLKDMLYRQFFQDKANKEGEQNGKLHTKSENEVRPEEENRQQPEQSILEQVKQKAKLKVIQERYARIIVVKQRVIQYSISFNYR